MQPLCGEMARGYFFSRVAIRGIFFSRGGSTADVPQKTWLFFRGYFSWLFFSWLFFPWLFLSIGVAIFVFAWLFCCGYFSDVVISAWLFLGIAGQWLAIQGTKPRVWQAIAYEHYWYDQGVRGTSIIIACPGSCIPSMSLGPGWHGLWHEFRPRMTQTLH